MKNEDLTQREIENIIRDKCIAYKCSYRQVSEWVYEIASKIKLGVTEIVKIGRFETRGSRDVVNFVLSRTIEKVITEFNNELFHLKEKGE
jgi:hypothetical protein